MLYTLSMVPAMLSFVAFGLCRNPFSLDIQNAQLCKIILGQILNHPLPLPLSRKHIIIIKMYLTSPIPVPTLVCTLCHEFGGLTVPDFLADASFLS
jgi:hypothetical protein